MNEKHDAKQNVVYLFNAIFYFVYDRDYLNLHICILTPDIVV